MTLPWIQAEPVVFVAKDGARVTVREVVTGGYLRLCISWRGSEELLPGEDHSRFPRLVHWTVAVDGRRVDSFLSKRRAIACAKAIGEARRAR